MATRNVKATVATITLSGSSEPITYVVYNKKQLQKLLYSVAARNWSSMGTRSIPKSKTDIVNIFFGKDAGNSYTTTNCVIMSDEVLQVSMTSADKLMDKLRERSEATTESTSTSVSATND